MDEATLNDLVCDVYLKVMNLAEAVTLENTYEIVRHPVKYYRSMEDRRDKMHFWNGLLGAAALEGMAVKTYGQDTIVWKLFAVGGALWSLHMFFGYAPSEED